MLPRAGGRARRFLLGLAALVATLVIVLAVPAVLLAAWRFLGPPIPSLHELAAPDDGTLFVRVLCLVGWFGWATLVWALLAEILAQWRGWQLPALGWQQRAATGLITAITLMSGPSALAAAPPTPVLAAAAATTSPSSGPAIDSTTVATAAAPASGYLEHQVRPGEQLPTLAGRYLGDKYQWPTIASATYGLPQPDGRTLRPGDTRVYPGWTVRIPNTEPAGPGMLPVADASSVLVYQVRHGDWLWHISERFLGTPDRYRDIAALNPGLITADSGPHGPDHIEGGWKLVLPADAHDRGARIHAAGTVLNSPPIATDAASGGSTPQADPPADTATTAPASPSPPMASPSNPASPGPVAPDPTTSATPADPRGASSAATEGGAVGGAHDDALLIATPLIGAGLLAALLLGALRRRRRQQEQHRPAGRRVPDPAQPKAETHMRVVAEPAAVDRLDRALRALAVGLADRPATRLPDIIGVWLNHGDVTVLLTDSCPQPPAPWIDNEPHWTLPADATLPQADGQLAPLPALVTVGSQPDAHLLVDLERLGVLTITGDPERAGDLLRYLAAELALNSWSDHVEIVLAGFDAGETDELLALGADRVTAAPGIADAIEHIRRRAGQVVQAIDHLEVADPLAGRINDVAADAWMPHVLLARNPNPDDIATLQALDNDLAASGRAAVAVAVAADVAVGRWHVTVDPEGNLDMSFLGLSKQTPATAARLPRDELAGLADVLKAARQGTTTPQQPGRGDPDAEADWPPVPPAPETEPWARGTDASGGLLVGLDELLDHADETHDEHDLRHDDEPESIDRDLPHDDLGVPVDGGPSGSEPVPAEASGPPVVALVGRQPVRERVNAPARTHRHSDPTLAADLRAWIDGDPARPRIAILGPVTVEAPGHLPGERLRFYAEIITYLAGRGNRGATTDQFDEAIWPDQRVKANTRRVAVARARRWLGEAPDGQPWLPDATAERRYRLREGYLFDWHLFRRLRARGESRGPAGVADLREALNLVRGAPLADADVAYSAVARNPYPWLPLSDLQPHHLAAAVVDTAHRLVDLCLGGGDVAGARWAVERAWLADPDRASDIAWRDLLRVAAAEGNLAELDQLLGELMAVRDAEVPEDLDRDTYRLLCDLMPHRIHAGAH